MKDTRWRTWEIIGLFWTLAAGNLLHFVYDWTGSSVAAALFSAVNESTWEHMKLLAVPWILFSLVEYIVLRSGGIAGPRAVGLLVGLTAIPLLFYGYKGVVGQGNMIVDILIFQVSVLLSFWVSWSLQKRRRSAARAGRCWACWCAWGCGHCSCCHLPGAGSGGVCRSPDGDEGHRLTEAGKLNCGICPMTLSGG